MELTLPEGLLAGNVEFPDVLVVEDWSAGEHQGVKVAAAFSLQLVNHRTDRKERIRSGSLHVKKGRFLFWKKTILEVPVKGGIENLELPPQSPTILQPIDAQGSTRLANVPKRVLLVLSLKMVGPMRKKEIGLGQFSLR